MSDDLMERLKKLRDRLHKDESDGSTNVHWHPDGFTVDDAIEEIKRLRAEVLTVLSREAETTKRHDARLDALEGRSGE